MKTEGQTTALAGDVPGPPPISLSVNQLELRRSLLDTLRSGALQYGDLFRVRFGRFEVYVVSSPELAHDILIKRPECFPRARNNAALNLLFGDSLASTKNHRSWMAHRRIVQSMFHRQRLGAMSEQMVGIAQRMLNRWSRIEPGTTIYLEKEVMNVTQEIIIQAMFGINVEDECASVNLAARDMLSFVRAYTEDPFRPANRRFAYLREALHDIVMRLIDERRASGQPRGDLLDLLLEVRDADTGEAMPDEAVCDELMTIFAAGYEVTTHTLCFAWYALAQHSQHLARLHREVDDVLGDREPTLDDLARLEWTHMVFEETMRHYPTSPSLKLRVAGEDARVGGYLIPADAFVVVSVYNIHHNPRFWPDPDRFDPTRFRCGASERHTLAWMPFGAGPHKCIGNHLAMMEGLLLLASVARRFELRLVDEQDVRLEEVFTLKPQGGLPMALHPRVPLH